MKIIKSLEESGLLIKGVRKTIKNKAKKQKEGFLKMSLGTLGANLMGNLLIKAQLAQVNSKLEQMKEQLKQVKTQLEQTRVLNATSSFNKSLSIKV